MGFNFEKFLEDSKRYIDQDDPIPASEKLYKCGEEAIKFLAEKLDLPEYQEAQKNGRWDARLLFKAVGKLSDRINREIRHWWEGAWVLHVEGFHEKRLDIREITRRLGDVESLIKIVKNYE
jgi:DNA-directed RNA polymerase beta' subunit